MEEELSVSAKALAHIHAIVSANRAAGAMIEASLEDPNVDSVIVPREDLEALQFQLLYSAHIMTTLAEHQAQIDDKFDALIKKYSDN